MPSIKNMTRPTRAKIFIGLGLIAAALALGYYKFGASTADNNSPNANNASGATAGGKGGRAGMGGGPMMVGIATVKKEDAPLQLNALGTVSATATATVRSRVDGELMKVHFTEGQFVKQGQLLAELDVRSYQAALTQAQGALMRDQALLQNAKVDLGRYQQLLAQNSISKQQVDTQAALVNQYTGTVKVDQGSVDNAKLQVTYSRITAPISGRAGLRLVDLGNVVRASDAAGLVVITQTQPINVLFAVPEVSLSQVLAADAKNKPLKVEAWDRENKNKIADGVLLAIDNQLNVATGTVNIKAKFANAKSELFPNQFVNVHLQLGNQISALTVPSVAVQLGKVGTYVYVLNDDQTVTVTKVKVGAGSGENTIIEEGLKEGQRVVIDGVDKLRDGAKVRVADRSKGAAGGASGVAAGGGAWAGRGQKSAEAGKAASGSAAAGNAPTTGAPSERTFTDEQRAAFAQRCKAWVSAGKDVKAIPNPEGREYTDEQRAKFAQRCEAMLQAQAAH